MQDNIVQQIGFSMPLHHGSIISKEFIKKFPGEFCSELVQRDITFFSHLKAPVKLTSITDLKLFLEDDTWQRDIMRDAPGWARLLAELGNLGLVVIPNIRFSWLSGSMEFLAKLAPIASNNALTFATSRLDFEKSPIPVLFASKWSRSTGDYQTWKCSSAEELLNKAEAIRI